MSAQKVGNRFNERKRFWVWAVTFILVMALLGASWALVSDNAWGRQTVDRGTQHLQEDRPDGAVECCSADVKRFARKAAKRFRAGHIRRDHGFRPGAVYRAPQQARRVWVGKIHRWILAHPGHLRALPPRSVAGRACYPAQTCYAADLYQDTVGGASCVTGSYPAAAQGACDRAPWHNGPGLTKKQVQVGGSVIFCGGGVVLGVATAPPTGGGSVAFVAFWGALSCGWSFWTTVSGGGSW